MSRLSWGVWVCWDEGTVSHRAQWGGGGGDCCRKEGAQEGYFFKPQK